MVDIYFNLFSEYCSHEKNSGKFYFNAFLNEKSSAISEKCDSNDNQIQSLYTILQH